MLKRFVVAVILLVVAVAMAVFGYMDTMYHGNMPMVAQVAFALSITVLFAAAIVFWGHRVP